MSRFLYIGTPKKISDLQTPGQAIGKLKREDVKLAIIDDEEFPYLDLLRQHKFNIDTYKDIDNLASLNVYDIILCDVSGVGKKFSEKYQGAYLVKEIYKLYPFKIILSYTGISFDARYNEYLKYADFSLKKDIDSEEWVDKLDVAIDLVSNVEKRWNRIRDYLLADNVSLLDVLLLEDDFVRKIQRGKTKKFPSAKLTTNIRDGLRQMLISFAGSAAVQLLIP